MNGWRIYGHYDRIAAASRGLEVMRVHVQLRSKLLTWQGFQALVWNWMSPNLVWTYEIHAVAVRVQALNALQARRATSVDLWGYFTFRIMIGQAHECVS